MAHKIMKRKFLKLIAAPLHEKLNMFTVVWQRFLTWLFYKPVFHSVGKRSAIIKPMMIGNALRIKIGSGVLIRDGGRLEAVGDAKSGPVLLSIEDGVCIEQRVHITAASNLIIGRNTTISANVYISDIDHEYEQIGVHILAQPLKVARTLIGENCFIGLGVSILGGTILGKQCIVGTHSVVRGVFPDYCVLVGAPARIVKRYNVEREQWLKTDSKGNFL